MTTTPVLDPEDVSQVIQRYQRRIAEHGATFASLNSGSEAKQAIRHLIHASALRGERPSILEVGCGLGDFYKYLIAQKRNCSYHGYDIVPEYIAECQRVYPQAKFAVRNIFLEGIDGDYDSVVMSQVLNNRYQKSDNLKVMQRALELAFQHTRVSVSVDMLSTYVDFRNPDLFYYSPEEIFRIAKAIAPRVVIRHDYRAFEFCVQLFHPGSRGLRAVKTHLLCLTVDTDPDGLSGKVTNRQALELGGAGAFAGSAGRTRRLRQVRPRAHHLVHSGGRSTGKHSGKPGIPARDLRQFLDKSESGW